MKGRSTPLTRRVAPLLDEETTVSEAIVRTLHQAGISAVFGMPGGNTVWSLFDALVDNRDRIRTVSVREESIATIMAEVAGRLTGRPAVASGQGAFLLTSAGVEILEGLLTGSPMLVLSEFSDRAPFTHHAPYQAGLGGYGNWDARATIAGYTKQVLVAHQPVEAVQITQLAIKHSLLGQPGPVAVLYHSLALEGRVGPKATPRLYSTGPYLPAEGFSPSPALIASAIELLARAERPVILAGNGARLAREELRHLAERLGAPVATSPSGKGVFPETHPLALGLYGTFGLEAANAVVAEADFVLAVGTKLSPSDTANENPALLDPERQTFVQIDVEPRNASWTFPCDLVLVGDAAWVLQQLDAAADEIRLPEFDGVRRVAQAHGHFRSFEVPESGSSASPLVPQRIVAELTRAVPNGAVVTADAGENRLFLMHHFRTKDAVDLLQPAGTGGMGYAIPAALAAKAIHPDRPAVAVCGDGGFAMTMNGLMTAVEERLPIEVVVLNNAALGWVLHGQGTRVNASKFGQFDHAAVARALGCDGVRVERADEFPAALDRGLAAKRPFVIDVATSLDYSFQSIRSNLAAFPKSVTEHAATYGR